MHILAHALGRPEKPALKVVSSEKLRWVESVIFWQVWASYHGAGYYFVVLGSLHLVYTFFPFPVSTAQIIGEFWRNRLSGTSNVAPLVLTLYSSHSWYYWCCVASSACRQSGETLAMPIGEARRIHSANKKLLQIFFICCASPFGRVIIIGPIVLAQHKGNERIGKAWTPICGASPIVIEITH